MKKNIKWIIIALALVVIIGGAYVLYDKLSDDVDLNNLVNTTEPTNENVSKEAETAEQKYHTAPDFTVLDENGKEVKLSDYRGKPVVINFWTTWCYYCKEEMPTFDKLCKEYGDIQFLMVNATDNVSETVQVAQKFKEDSGYSFPVFFDTNQEAVSAYGITSYPQSYFVDKDGRLIARQPGMMNEELLRKAISMITE